MVQANPLRTRFGSWNVRFRGKLITETTHFFMCVTLSFFKTEYWRTKNAGSHQKNESDRSNLEGTWLIKLNELYRF